MIECLPRGNSLVPRGRLELHASHCFLFFAACVQRSLLCFFSLTPALDRACIAGREERAEHLRCSAGTEPLRISAAAVAHAGGGGSPAASRLDKMACHRCSTTNYNGLDGLRGSCATIAGRHMSGAAVRSSSSRGEERGACTE